MTEQAGETTCRANLGLELCFTILVNMSKLKNIERKLLRSALKQVAESERVMQIRRQIGDLFLKHLGEYAQVGSITSRFSGKEHALPEKAAEIEPRVPVNDIKLAFKVLLLNFEKFELN